MGMLNSLQGKYSLQSMADLIGRSTIRDTVVEMLQQDKMPRTILITGYSGSGKTAVSRSVARAISLAEDEIRVHIEADLDDVIYGQYMPEELEGVLHTGEKFTVIYDDFGCVLETAGEDFIEELGKLPSRALVIVNAILSKKLSKEVLGFFDMVLDLKKPEPDELRQFIIKICEAEGIPYDESGVLHVIAKSGGNIRMIFNALAHAQKENKGIQLTSLI